MMCWQMACDQRLSSSSLMAAAASPRDGERLIGVRARYISEASAWLSDWESLQGDVEQVVCGPLREALLSISPREVASLFGAAHVWEPIDPAAFQAGLYRLGVHQRIARRRSDGRPVLFRAVGAAAGQWQEWRLEDNAHLQQLFWCLGHGSAQTTLQQLVDTVFSRKAVSSDRKLPAVSDASLNLARNSPVAQAPIDHMAIPESVPHARKADTEKAWQPSPGVKAQVDEAIRTHRESSPDWSWARELSPLRQGNAPAPLNRHEGITSGGTQLSVPPNQDSWADAERYAARVQATSAQSDAVGKKIANRRRLCDTDSAAAALPLSFLSPSVGTPGREEAVAAAERLRAAAVSAETGGSSEIVEVEAAAAVEAVAAAQEAQQNFVSLDTTDDRDQVQRSTEEDSWAAAADKVNVARISAARAANAKSAWSAGYTGFSAEHVRALQQQSLNETLQAEEIRQNVIAEGRQRDQNDVEALSTVQRRLNAAIYGASGDRAHRIRALFVQGLPSGRRGTALVASANNARTQEIGPAEFVRLVRRAKVSAASVSDVTLLRLLDRFDKSGTGSLSLTEFESMLGGRT